MNIILLLRIYLTSQINSFIVFLRKVPIVNKFITDKAFGKYRLKKSIALLGIIYDFVGKIIGSTIGFLIFVTFLSKAVLREEAYTDFRLTVLYVALYVIYPFFNGSAIFSSSTEDQMFIHYFMVNPVPYYKYKGLKALFFNLITYIPALIYQFRQPLIVITLVLLKVAGSAFTNMAYLMFFNKMNRQPNKRVRRLCGLGFVIAVYFACGKKLIPDVIVPNRGYIITSVICAMIIIIGIAYMLNYKKYRELAIKYADKGIIIFMMSSGGNMDPDAADIIDKDSEYHRAYFAEHKNLTPEAYIDKTFRKRYRKAIWNPIITDVIIDAIILGVLGYVVRLGWINITAETLANYSPILVTVAISASLVPASIYRYFRNVDLIYIRSRMITKEFLKKLMLKRYIRTIGIDLVIAVAITIAAAVFLLTSGIKYPLVDFAWLMVSIVPVLIIYDTYEWLMYYLVQPYSADLVAKSPVFSVMGYVTSILMILLLFIRANMAKFLIPIIGITIFSMVIYYIASNFAYKTFKIRF